ncbi:MAG: asparagine synthase (glutamine-hydrolyzing), partial [Actinomycetes bacterium]
MCGIVGLLDTDCALRHDELTTAVTAMSRSVAHRGPDDDGSYVDAAAGLALAHRRLAVLDLSPSGHQPMMSQSGRHVLVFNGEVYNFRRLRRQLEREGVRFRGSGDTEVLLQGWERWGPDRLLREVNGMFAMAMWDTRDRTLTLVRDRLGEKPLYWARAGSVVGFASELAALRHVPGLTPTIDRVAIAEMLRWGFVPGEQSVLAGVSRLPAGSLAVVSGREAQVRRYWDVAAIAETAAARRSQPSPDGELVERTRDLLSDAVALRLESDVPLGTFLSGGIDSTLVTAVAAQAAPSVRTFTVGMS